MNLDKLVRTLLILGLLGVSTTLYGCGGGGGGTSTTPQTQTVAALTFTPPAGTYTSDQTVAVTCPTSGATIYYTTDGSIPSTSSNVYNGTIPVTGAGTTMTITVMGAKAGMTNSPISSATYVITGSSQNQTVAAPVFSPAGGTYTGNQSVTISSSTTGAAIHYTTDGSLPTASSTLYSGPIAVTGTTTISAMAMKSGMTDSTVATATYTISAPVQTVAAPVFSPVAGTYASDQTVTIACATSGATIYYTTDGSSPTTSSSVYGASIPVAGNGTTMTITAMAVKAGMTNSAVATATYTINIPVTPTVIFSYAPSTSGGLIQSSWVAPNGSGQDVYIYKDFTLTSTQTVREVDWRGGYIQNAAFGRVTDFTLTFYDSTAGGTQPNATRPDTPETTYLAKYTVGGNAGETLAGVVGGTTMYDYKFVLPTPFQAVAGTKYWLRIEAAQGTFPDWGIALGTGGNGQLFKFSTGLAMFTMVSGADIAFSLLQ